MMGQLPRLHGAEADGQTGGFAESAFVILVDLGLGKGLD
jgi:hypothetical protein